MKWFVGSDHAGYRLKQQLAERLRALGDEVVDLGTTSEDSVDYPDFAEAVGKRVAADKDARGLLVCGTGIGIAMAANKVPGVRAAVVTDEFTARMARAHNDANVIALGQRVIGPGIAEEALDVFRDTMFAGGRHERRLDKIAALEARGAREASAAGDRPAVAATPTQELVAALDESVPDEISSLEERKTLEFRAVSGPKEGSDTGRSGRS